MSLKRNVALVAGCIFLVLCQPVGRSQSDTATVTGRVLDPTTATVPNATITVLNVETQIISRTFTNQEGLFTVSGLSPGSYRIEAAKLGFKTVIKPDVVLHLQDVVALNFNMTVGSASESVTVEGGASILNTTDGSVGTVISRLFVENMPLNGRSFQGLILLTPGVTTNTPQTGAAIGSRGEFSVNGQRTESNYYTVDGVSANLGVAPGMFSAASNSGSLPGSTALGTTQALLSVDALEEFRVESSTYSAEYGRNPGGQFSFVTRSGTNQRHGTVFNYLRNDVFDANNWFNNYFGQPRAPLRQNDFGGTLGGPIIIPHIYEGKEKAFFFLSYEGLRLLQPQASSVSYVPTTALRQSAPIGLQPVLNAFPVSNCSGSIANCTNDLGNGLGEFVGTWANPGAIDAYSIRFDHALRSRMKLFLRFSDTASNIMTRVGGNGQDPSVRATSNYESRTYTFGMTASASNTASDEFRLNYSSNESALSAQPDGFGAASAVNLVQLQGLDPGKYPDASINVGITVPGYSTSIYQYASYGQQRQWNAVNTFVIVLGKQEVKVGADFRRLAPQQVPINPNVIYTYSSLASVKANSVNNGFARSTSPAYPTYSNFSAFVADQWRVAKRLNLSFGLRWEVNPAPSAPRGNLPYTVAGNINDPTTLALAPQGTPLWQTTWRNVAPRVGGAYVLPGKNDFETVLRGGFGVFFDSGQQLGGYGYQGPGFAATQRFGGARSPASFPVAPSQVTPAIVNPPVPPYGPVFANSPTLELPFTLQWNASIEQAFGKAQSLTLSYVGSSGRRLLELKSYFYQAAPDFPSGINYFTNGLTSDYDALQLQFQRRLTHGFQALTGYTWAHAIDYGSFNVAKPYKRGNSDLDVGHTFVAALMYTLPNVFHNSVARTVLNDWGIDSRFTGRTGFPITLDGQPVFDPTTGLSFNGGLNTASGQPLYLYGSQFPGGRSVNPGAFARPPVGQFGDAPRNFVRGFGAWQLDLALRKDFSVYERLKVQFRAEAFNICNHPNFGTVNPFFGSTTFGQATATLAQSLGGVSPLYQLGGSRSLQLSLKLMF
jgi:hypothetical protein